ncbi:tetraspanin-8-like [Centropristis striata]|uniref:tetraspanin-8-like n=1 Tax=Centropristis striata TaxID=184440 RepID=UPI0027E04B5B|nr:tetraspanin-8-like [Centropristis striata]
MAQVNACIKRLLTIFNIFFAIVGGVIIALALLSQVLTNVNGGDLEGRTTGLILLYVVGAVTLVIAILGAYGAHKESKVCLIVFLVCMVVGSLLMLRAGITTAIARPRVEPLLEEKFRELLPLDKASADVRDMTESLQRQLQCCGLFSYQDWEDQIPDSCLCDEEEEEEGLCTSIGYRVIIFPSGSVYSKPCFSILMRYVLMIFDVMIGVVFTLAALALIGLALSSVAVHQLRYRDNRPSVLLSVPAVFTMPPPKYQELHNPPAY